MKIKLLENIEGYMTIFEKGEIFEPNEPYQGFNEDNSFTICQGMNIDIKVEEHQFEIIE